MKTGNTAKGWRTREITRWETVLAVGVLGTACLLISGCASSRYPWSPSVHSTPDTKVVLTPGDALNITFLGAPELDVSQTVRRDGKISLRIIGEIQAEGKTPSELQAEIAKLYAPQLQIKETSVFVQSMSPVYVGGAVRQPGQLSVARPVTALEAIMQAGGFNEREAELRNVLVIRHRDGKRFGYSLDFKKTLVGKPSPVFYLRPFDIVYVPRTTITKVNQWVDQYISGIIPDLGVGFTTAGDLTVSQ